MKFKVGDKVKVRKDLKVYERYGNMTYVDDMEKMRGKIVTIKEVDNDSYRIKEFGHRWTDEMLEDKTIFTKSDLKDGDKCTLKNGRVVYFSKDEKYSSNYNFDKLDKNMKYQYNDEVSIIKVERPIQYTTVFERKEEILDETEKRYLRDVIRPFRSSIDCIEKVTGSEVEHLKINFKDYDYMNFKNFKKGAMYKNMEANKEYTLKELEL